MPLNSKMIAFAFAAVACAGWTSFAAETTQKAEATKPEKEGWSWAPGEGVSFGEQSMVAAEASVSFNSKYLSYGFVDNNHPIMVPDVNVTFFDWLCIEAMAIYDLTPYGRKRVDGERIYGDRQLKYTEFGPGAYLCHDFSKDDYKWLPTTVGFLMGYTYEYHPRRVATASWESQFWTLEVTLPELLLEPKFTYERDTDRDNGTYLNLEIGHTFELSELNESLEGVTFRPSVSQGFGNAARMRGYLCNHHDEPLDHAGLMDTFIKGTLEWSIADGVTFAGYVGYSDFIFDSTIREAARHYEASGDWEKSWNFVGGLSLTLTF